MSDLKLLSKALVSKLHGSGLKIDLPIKKQTQSHQIQKLRKKQIKGSKQNKSRRSIGCSFGTRSWSEVFWS